MGSPRTLSASSRETYADLVASSPFSVYSQSRTEHNAHRACFACHRRTPFCDPKQLVNARWVNPKLGQEEDAPVEDESAESASESEDKPDNENDDHNSDSAAPPPQDDGPPPAHDSNPPSPSSSSSSASSSGSIAKQSVPEICPPSPRSPHRPPSPLPRFLQSRRRPRPSSRQRHKRNDEAWPTLPRSFPLNRRKYR